MTINKYPEKEGAACIICKKGFSDKEWEYRHLVHQTGCLFQNDDEPKCDCDDVAHEEHCPQCIVRDLTEHLPLNTHGNIYTITVEQVMNTVHEFIRRNPDLVEKIGSLDMLSLAVEIQDYIGGIGIMDHIEMTVAEAIKERIERETETDAQDGR